MAVVITGGCGFIGMATAQEFLEAGYEVVAVDRVPPRQGMPQAANARFRFVQGDVQDRDLILSVLKETGMDPVVHLAGILTAGCDRDPDRALAVNVLGARSVLDAALKSGGRTVTVASTIGVYGRGLPQPVDETMPTEPDGWYGLTKIMVEQMGLLYARRHGLDFRAVRPAAVTGPGRTASSGSATLWTSFIPEKAALGEPYDIEVEPYSSCPVIYIKDAGRAFFTLATAPKAPRRIYNFSSGNAVASELVAVAKSRVPEAQFTYKPDPVIMAVMDGFSEWTISCKAAEEDLGWRPAYDVPQMVDDIMEAARSR